MLDVREAVGPVRRARGCIADGDSAGSVDHYRVVAPRAAEDGRIVAASTVQGVVSCPAGEQIVASAGLQEIIAAKAVSHHLLQRGLAGGVEDVVQPIAVEGERVHGEAGRGEVPGHNHVLAGDGEVLHRRDGEVGDAVPIKVDQDAQPVGAGGYGRGIAGASGRSIDEQRVDARAADHHAHARWHGVRPATLRQQQRVRQIKSLVTEPQVFDAGEGVGSVRRARPKVLDRRPAQAIGGHEVR